MKRKLIAVCAALLAAEGAYAENGFSNTVFFGDSLTDSGYFRPLLQQVGVGGGAFTTNPDATWAQYVAEAYGHDAVPNGNGQSGSNYAVGGARVTAAVSNTSLGVAVDVPSVAAQVDTYLSSCSGRADGNALYTVWGGANDLLAAAAAPAEAAQLLGSAAAQEAAVVKQLSDAGARYILVPNLPDVGLTPMATTAGTAAQSSAAAQAYNTMLYGNMRSTGANVIWLDMFTLLQQVGANPEAYGFSNFSGTACTTASSLTCTRETLRESGAENSYFFADGIHPSGGAHRVIGQYAQSVLSAPAQIGAVADAALTAGTLTRDRVERRLNQTVEAGSHWWAEAYGSDMAGADADGKMRPGLALGMDYADGAHRSGAYLHHAEHRYDWARGGGFALKQTGAGVYHRYRQGAWWLDAQAGYDHLKADTDRDVQLGATTHRHHAEGSGHLFGAALKGGRQWQYQNLAYGPVVGLSYSRVLLDALAEDNRSAATSMRFEKQALTSWKAGLGMQADYAAGNHWHLFGSAVYERELKPQNRMIEASLHTVSAGGFVLPAAEKKRNGVLLNAGAAFDTGKFRLSGGISRRSGAIQGTGVFLGVSGKF